MGTRPEARLINPLSPVPKHPCLSVPQIEDTLLHNASTPCLANRYVESQGLGVRRSNATLHLLRYLLGLACSAPL